MEKLRNGDLSAPIAGELSSAFRKFWRQLSPGSGQSSLSPRWGHESHHLGCAAHILTHDYYRHGTTTLFAALDVANGSVLTQWKPRHRHQEFLSFLRHIDTAVPSQLDLHLIVDNYATHKHPRVRGWLARHERFHIHYIPTYSSWLNQVERWFGLITQRDVRRGSFTSVTDPRLGWKLPP